MKNQLESHLLVIAKILLHANSSFEVVKYFQSENENDAPIVKYEKVMNKFFHFTAVNFYRITIIELCKLYNHKEVFSLQKLLSEFENNKSYYGLLDHSEIKNLRKHLKENRLITEELITLRNSHYAHQDGDYLNYLSLSTSKVNQLLNVAKVIFNSIYGRVLEKSYNFDFPLGTPMDDLDFIMTRLKFYDEQYRIMEKEINDFIK